MSIPDTSSTATPDSVAEAQQAIAWLLQQFTADVPGATHALLLSREGLRLLDSGVDKDWADHLAAAISGVASLAANMTGPTHRKSPAKQVLIERDDCLVLVQGASLSSTFGDRPGTVDGHIRTILAVITTPTADVGTVGYEMARLITRFEPYMKVPVRAPEHEAQ
ncbi:roadblock/LC7 domain-containing protein [Streptomyces sp. SID8381]|uniref:roadblock/LC7 domain-containing protein n=1 Tax=unclassified Streptomyces TaxID=2593676 RepID=UPI00037A2680|nr:MULTISPECIES: roadblock/LC7 domain-containing protein [unclassified Streptomyces]MYX27454.1 roadblock/LC7 domain-containing protein [Streptomyces sp. SID8381]